jgi:hypothetical protein
VEAKPLDQQVLNCDQEPVAAKPNAHRTHAHLLEIAQQQVAPVRKIGQVAMRGVEVRGVGAERGHSHNQVARR